jgi:hypothetical protein
MFEPELLVSLLQTVTSALVLLCLWFAKVLWRKVESVEEDQAKHRLELEVKISELKLDTTTRLVSLELRDNATPR